MSFTVGGQNEPTGSLPQPTQPVPEDVRPEASTTQSNPIDNDPGLRHSPASRPSGSSVGLTLYPDTDPSGKPWSELYAAAIRYNSMGFTVVPLGAGGRPLRKWLHWTQSPIHQHPGHLRLLDWQEVQAIALVVGCGNLLALDFDTQDQLIIDRILHWLDIEPSYLWLARSGGGGRHCYLLAESTPSELEHNKYVFELSEGRGKVEVLQHTHLVTVPPSRHRDEHHGLYQFLNSPAVPEAPLEVRQISKILEVLGCFGALQEPKAKDGLGREPVEPASDNPSVAEAIRLFDLVAFLQEHFPGGGELEREPNGDVRICGNEGLIIGEKESGPCWTWWGREIHGGVLDAIAYVLHDEPDFSDLTPAQQREVFKVLEERTGIKLSEDESDKVFHFRSPGDRGKESDPVNGMVSGSPPRDETADEAVARLNQRFALVTMGHDVAIIDEKDPLDPQFLKPPAFKILLANQTRWEMRGNKMVRVPLSRIWLEDPERREYGRVIFEPEAPSAGDYNMYHAPEAIPQPGPWCHIERHLRDVICSGVEEYFNYLMDWIAHMIQQPGEKPGVAIVMRSGKGTGKGILVTHILAPLVGPGQFCHVTTMDQLTGRFNRFLSRAILVFADEALFGGDRRSQKYLDTLVTEKTIMLELKNFDAVQVGSYARYMLATNDHWVLHSSPDERRYFCLDVSGRHAQDPSYFRPLIEKWIPAELPCFLHALLRRDLSRFDAWNPPKTEALREQAVHSMDSFESWVAEWIDNGYITLDGSVVVQFEAEGVEPQLIATCSEVYRSYLEHAARVNDRYPLKPQSFGARLKKVFPLERFQRRELGTREWCYNFGGHKDPAPEAHQGSENAAAAT